MTTTIMKFKKSQTKNKEEEEKVWITMKRQPRQELQLKKIVKALETKHIHEYANCIS